MMAMTKLFTSLLALTALSLSVSFAGEIDVGKFIHITDIHSDTNYLPFTSSNCTAVDLCCHFTSEPAPGAQKQVAGIEGDYLCDLPQFLAERAVAYVASLANDTNNNIDFVVWSGDAPSHAVLEQSRELNLQTTTHVSRVFHDWFDKTKIPIIPSLGDHDTYPLDQLEPPPVSSWLFKGLTKGDADWSGWLDGDAITTFEYGGYFSRKIGKLNIVVINPLWEVSYNAYVTLNETWEVSQAQKRFVIEALDAAVRDGDYVWVISHIPCGHYTLLDTFETWWTNLTLAYSHVLKAQFSGHTHTSQFRLFSAPGELPVSALHVTGSATTYQFLNPSIRVYSYNRANGDVLDFEEHRCDILKSNREKKPCDFQPAFSFTQMFDLNDVSPQSLQSLVEKMEESDDLFEKFYRRERCADYPFLKPITKEVKRMVLCQLKFSQRVKINECEAQDQESSNAIYANVFQDPDYCPSDGLV